VCCWRELLKASFLQHVTNAEPPYANWERCSRLTGFMLAEKQGTEHKPDAICLCAKKAVYDCRFQMLSCPPCLTGCSKFAIVELQIEYPG
jgi:hypothetical protein